MVAPTTRTGARITPGRGPALLCPAIFWQPRPWATETDPFEGAPTKVSKGPNVMADVHTQASSSASAMEDIKGPCVVGSGSAAKRKRGSKPKHPTIA